MTTLRHTRTPEARTHLAGRAELPATVREGRLSYSSGRGPRSVVVRFAVADGQALIRLPEYHDALGHAAGQTVSLTADPSPLTGAQPDALTVTGTAHVSDGRAGAAVEEALDEHWPIGLTTHLLTLPWGVATGGHPDLDTHHL